MKRFVSALFVTGLLLGLGVPIVGSGVVSAAPAPKVTICHKTESETNPWVIITVSENSLKGHFSDKHHNGQDDFLIIGEGESCPTEDGGEGDID